MGTGPWSWIWAWPIQVCTCTSDALFTAVDPRSRPDVRRRARRNTGSSSRVAFARSPSRARAVATSSIVGTTRTPWSNQCSATSMTACPRRHRVPRARPAWPPGSRLRPVDELERDRAARRCGARCDREAATLGRRARAERRPRARPRPNQLGHRSSSARPGRSGTTPPRWRARSPPPPRGADARVAPTSRRPRTARRTSTATAPRARRETPSRRRAPATGRPADAVCPRRAWPGCRAGSPRPRRRRAARASATPVALSTARATMATTGTSTFWLPTAEKTRAMSVAPDARWSTIHDVTDRSNAVEPSGRSAVASHSPLAMVAPSTTPKSTTTPAKSASHAPGVARTGRTGWAVRRPAGSCARFCIGPSQGSSYRRRARKRVRLSPGIVPAARARCGCCSQARSAARRDITRGAGFGQQAAVATARRIRGSACKGPWLDADSASGAASGRGGVRQRWAVCSWEGAAPIRASTKAVSASLVR